jgi:cardiolipin synthase
MAAFEGAKEEIYFETYIFAEDDTGPRRQGDALMRAARRGVKVRVITDWFGTGQPLHQLRMAHSRQAGVHYRMFNPWFRAA